MPIKTGRGRTSGVNYTYFLKSQGPTGFYQWRLSNLMGKTENILETDTFYVGGSKWKLRLCLNYNYNNRDVVAMHLVSENNAKLDVWFKVTALNQEQCRSDHALGKTMTLAAKQGHGFFSLMDISLLTDRRHGFLMHNYVIFTAEIAVLRSNDLVIGEPVATMNRPVKIELLTADDIREHINARIRFGLSGKTKNPSYTFSELTSLDTVQQKIMADANNDVRLWLCDQLNDGSLAMNHCLESLPLRSLCLGDLKHQGRSETGDLHMQFYLEEEDDYGFAPPGPETWLLFIKWYDRDLEEMTFLGTLALDKLTDWEDLLWHIFNMEELKHVDCDEGFSLEALYLEVEQIHLRQIDPTLSMEENGMRSGSILVVNGIGFEDCNPAAFAAELTEIFLQTLLDSDEPQNAPPACSSNAIPSSSSAISKKPQKVEEEGSECIVCMVKPQTSGFIHQNTSHKCVCESCAKLFLKENSVCPLCMKRIEHVVFKYF